MLRRAFNTVCSPANIKTPELRPVSNRRGERLPAGASAHTPGAIGRTLLHCTYQEMVVHVLHEFLASHHKELIGRCKSKASRRNAPRVTAAELEHGVPMFLGHLVEELRGERTGSRGDGTARADTSGAAALHGKRLLEEGYSVEQVVHDYGDICQAITELAKELNEPVSIDEFRTINRLLDNAIADAVASYGRHRETLYGAREELHGRIGALADEQRTLVHRALQALDAIKVGNIGVMGATGTLLEDSLVQLRDLVDRSLPEIRLVTGMAMPGSVASAPSGAERRDLAAPRPDSEER